MTKSDEARRIEEASKRTQNKVNISPTGVKRTFNKNENMVIQTLYAYGQPLTIRQIAKASELSWDTVSEAIQTLEEDEFIFSDVKHGKTYWNLNYTE